MALVGSMQAGTPNEAQGKAAIATRREVAAYNEALSNLEGKEDQAYDHLKAGILDEPAYKRQVMRVRDQRRHFTQLLEQANLAITGAVIETVKTTIELAKDAKTLWLSRSPEERREFLNDILSNPILDGAIIRYDDLKKPFVTLAEMKGKSDWRPLGSFCRTPVTGSTSE